MASPCEQAELARAGALLMSALSEAAVGRVALITGQAIAVGYSALAARSAADVVYAWPGSVIAPLASEAAVQVLMSDKIDSVEKREALEKDYADNIADGLNAAKRGYVDDVIEPAETRMMLAAALEMLAAKRDAHLPKKHGNLPF